MSPSDDLDQIRNGLVQFRLSDDAGSLHTLNAGEFAEVLLGLADFTRQMADAGLFGDGPPPQVRVRPPQDGSVVIEAVLQFSKTWKQLCSP